MDLDSEIHSASKIDTAIPRQLVLDYLLHNCYGETARAFMKDDLDAVRESEPTASAGRKGSNGNSHSNGHGHVSSHGNGNGNEVNNHTHSQHQGGVMTRSASSADIRPSRQSSSRQSRRTEEGSGGSLMETDKGEELDQEGDSPMGESHLDSSETLTAGTFTPDKLHALHIDEQLKNLETRKAIRSLISNGDIAPAMDLCNKAFPGVLSIDLTSPLTSPASIHMNFKMQCQKFIEIVKSDPERGPEALMFAQNVLHDFTRLDPAGEAQYMKHLEEIVSVIAYSDPQDSPNGHHLKQEARDSLADIMNSAVLGFNGMSCEPALLTIVKQATLVREYLAGDTSKSKRGLKAPARWRLASFLEETS